MTLTPVRSAGAFAGFRNLLSKEMGSWWRTKRWLVHLLLWLVVINGFVVLIWLDGRHNMTPEGGLRETMQVFFQAGGFFALIGAVLVTQGTIVGERRSGTAAWVLTKPTTRKAMVLSKLVAISISFLLLSLVVPCAVLLVQLQILWGRLPETIHFLEAAGLLALHQVFYVALTLLFGTLLQSRGAVAGVSLGFWISGNILPNLVPAWVVGLMPWTFTQAAANIALWRPVPVRLWVAALSCAVLAVTFVVLAMWRFEREEF